MPQILSYPFIMQIHFRNLIDNHPRLHYMQNRRIDAVMGSFLASHPCQTCQLPPAGTEIVQTYAMLRVWSEKFAKPLCCSLEHFPWIPYLWVPIPWFGIPACVLFYRYYKMGLLAGCWGFLGLVFRALGLYNV